MNKNIAGRSDVKSLVLGILFLVWTMYIIFGIVGFINLVTGNFDLSLGSICFSFLFICTPLTFIITIICGLALWSEKVKYGRVARVKTRQSPTYPRDKEPKIVDVFEFEPEVRSQVPDSPLWEAKKDVPESMPEVLYCSQCGKQILIESRFCAFCGSKVVGNE